MPYMPGVINQVPQITMQGGQQWLQALTGLAGNLDQLKKDDKAASALYDALTQEQPDPATGVPAPHPFKVNKDLWNAMSSKERVATAAGAMKGILFKQGLAEFKQKTDEAVQMMKLRKQQIASAKALTEATTQDTESKAEFGRDIFRAMRPKSPGLEDIMGALWGGVSLDNQLDASRAATPQALLQGLSEKGAASTSARQLLNYHLLEGDNARGNAPFFNRGQMDVPVEGALKGRYSQRVLGPNQSAMFPIPGAELPGAPTGMRLAKVTYDSKGSPLPTFELIPGEKSNLEKTDAEGVWYDRATGNFVKENAQGMFEMVMEWQAASERAKGSPVGAGKRGAKAQGGYEIGAAYSGLKYLGGDPNDSKNWEKVK